MKRFTVRRSKWRRGGPKNIHTMGYTNLLNEQGFMCCLGFACNQICRIPKKKLLGESLPDKVIGNESTFVDRHGVNKNFVYTAVRINDASYINDKVREARLKKLFKENGILVTFKD